MSTVVAFGENRAFFTCARNSSSWRNIPNDLSKTLNGSGRKYFWLAMGPSEQYFVAWSRRDGEERYELGDDTGVYASLDSKLDSLDTLENVKVTFGPEEGQWCILYNNGGYNIRGLGSTGLVETINRSSSKPKHVPLGAHGTWVVVFKDGSVEYELDDYYGNLENVLDDASDGDVKGVFLNPFNSTQYIVGFRNQRKKGTMPSEWFDLVKF